MVLLVMVANLAWLQAHSRSLDPEPVPEEPAVAVEVERLVKVNGYRTELVYNGEVVAARSTRAAFVQGGELESVLVDEGAQVYTGQPLARLDSRALEARRSLLNARLQGARARLQELEAGPRDERRRAAEARIDRVQHQLELARDKERRRQELYRQGAIAREQWQDFSTQVNTLEAELHDARQGSLELEHGTRPEVIDAQRAEVQSVQAQLAALQVEFEDSVLRAPYTAVVARRLLDEGAVVSPGTPVLELYENQNLEVRVSLPLETETPAAVKLSHGSQGLHARFLGWLPETDPASGTRIARYRLGRRLPPGTSVEATLKREVNEPGYWLPTNALVASGKGLFSCYLVNQGRLERHQLEVLHTEAERVLVRGTISAGGLAVVSGVERLVPGQSVTSLER